MGGAHSAHREKQRKKSISRRDHFTNRAERKKTKENDETIGRENMYLTV